MNVIAPNAVNSSAGAAGAGGAAKADVDYQSFLRLLVAQMRNQDPTAPMDATQYVSQLATFSQVEQSVQINGKLEQMLQSSALAQADAIIGRNLTSADGTVSGKVVEVKLTSTGVTARLEGGGEIAVGPGVVVK